MRSSVLVLALVALFSLTTVGHGKNVRLLDAAQKRIASLSHGAKRLFVNGDGDYALVKKLYMGASLMLIACNMSCGGGIALQGVTQQQQYVRSPEEILGRHVHFVAEGRDYVGYVADSPNSDEVSIDLYDGSIMKAKTSQVRGIRIDMHDDGGRQVIIDTNEEGKKFMHGFVVTVYDSNYYEIMIGAYVDFDNTLRIVEFPYIVVIPYDEITDVFGETSD